MSISFILQSLLQGGGRWGGYAMLAVTPAAPPCSGAEGTPKQQESLIHLLKALCYEPHLLPPPLSPHAHTSYTHTHTHRVAYMHTPHAHTYTHHTHVHTHAYHIRMHAHTHTHPSHSHTPIYIYSLTHACTRMHTCTIAQ